MKKLKARVSIVRWTGGKEGSGVRITFTDAASGCVAAEVRMSVEQFGFAVTGLSEMGCEMEFNDSGVVGKVREVKQEVVMFSKRPPDDKEIEVAMALYEKDGWEGYREDCRNHHNWVGGSLGVNVTFIRFVDPGKRKAAKP